MHLKIVLSLFATYNHKFVDLLSYLHECIVQICFLHIDPGRCSRRVHAGRILGQDGQDVAIIICGGN